MPANAVEDNGADLKPFPERGKPPGTRLGSAASAIEIFENLTIADQLSAKNRSRIQAMLDGEPPYSKEFMRKVGNAHRCNLNFGEGAAIVNAMLATYADLLESVPTLGLVRLTDTYEPTERGEIEDILSEELDTLLRRDWSEFDRTWDVLSDQFVKHGVGLVYWPDDDDWKFRSGGWDDFVIPRDTEASEDSIEIMVIVRQYTPSQLYRMIRNEEQARNLGWDVDAVKRELVTLTEGRTYRQGNFSNQWAKLQRELKSNDLGLDYAASRRSELLHFLVREYSGSYSHYIVPRCPSKEARFLYKKLEAIKSATQGFVLFTNGVGNGMYHSIRGQGYNIYNPVQEITRLRCLTVDQARISGSLLLQFTDSTDMEQPPMSVNGLVAYVPPGMKVVESGLEDQTNAMLELGREFSLLIQNNTGSFRARTINSSNAPKTRYEIMAQQETDSRISTSQANLFYRSWDKVLNEVWRRIKLIPEKSSRFPEVKDFYLRCLERGVPAEIIKKYAIRVLPQRAIGLGNPGQRQQALAMLGEMQGEMDERGRKLLARDRITTMPGLGRSYADRYCPKDEGSRPVLDEQFAQLENAALQQGFAIQRTEGQNDSVHAEVHIPALLDAIKALENLRESGQKIEPQQVSPSLQFLDVGIAHTTEHVEALQGDPERLPQYSAYRKAMQQISASFATFVRQVNKIMLDRRRELAESDQPGSDEQQHEVEAFRQKMQIMWETHRQRMQMKAEQVAQKMQIDRLKADQQLAAQSRKETQKLLTSSKRNGSSLVPQ